MKKLKMTSFINVSFLSSITSFIEQTSLAFGLEKKDALRLTLASEEVFSYLCSIIKEDKELEIICTDGIYFVSAEFCFDKIELELRAFNVTTEILSESEEDLRDMGLLIAARSVDHLSLKSAQGERLILRLTKDKSYPFMDEIKLPFIPPMTSYTVKTPLDDELKMFSGLIISHYKGYPFPPAFRFPGKLVDMVSSSIYKAAIACDERGLIGGGAIWRRMNEKIVEFFGPYLFNQPEGSPMAESLTNACLENLARTEILGLFSRYTTEDFPNQYFESIGSSTWYEKDMEPAELQSYYIQLHEDAGTYVYTSKALAPFIKTEYKRLFLPRDLYEIENAGAYSGDYSVFTSEFRREINQVALRYLLPGKDYRENILKHLALFRKEQILNIFFAIDLGIDWQAYIMDDLVECGFIPRIIIPYGGISDAIIFQYKQ